MSEKRHYYLLTFVSQGPNGSTRYHEIRVDTTLPHLSNGTVNKARQECKDYQGAALLAASYMGYMTEEEWQA